MKVNKILCVLCSLFFAFAAYAAEVSISVDKNVITEGETLLLTVEYTGTENETPDFSSLSKDFTIVSNSTSKRFNFVNGNMSYSTQWRIGLSPKKTGKIVISPIKIGHLISNQAEVEVKEMSDVAFVPDKRENSNSPYFQIDQSLDVSSPYVQQQTIFVVNVYDSIGLQNGDIFVNEEAKNNWVIIPLLSEPIVKQEVINNKHMNVATYAFAAFPQKSGEIATPVFSFDGYYVKNSSFKFPSFTDDIDIFGVDFHNVFGQKVPVKMKTKSENIIVKPIPSQFDAKNWLPLSNLDASATWSAKNGFKVGEAVTRTIELTAHGMTKSMLPPLTFEEVDGIKQYPEKPETNEQIIKGQVVTSVKINNIYIPTKSGNIVIPETKIKWFNVNTNKKELAIIPEETLFVVPNPSIKEEKTSLQEEDVKPTITETKPEPVTSKATEKQPDIKALALSLYAQYKNKILAGSALFVIVLVCLCFTFSRKKHNHYRDNVIKAIKMHDYKKAKEALIVWAQVKFYPESINNFNGIIQCVQNKDFSEQLSALNKLLYSSEADFFDDAKFIEIFKKADKIKTDEKKKIEALPNLYD